MKIMWLTATGVFVLLFALIALAHPASSVASGTHESAEGAAELFSRNCTSCHGRDGRATGRKARAKGARNLTDPQWQDRVSDERIFNSINNGKGHMPGFSKKLSEPQIDLLVQFVRSLKR